MADADSPPRFYRFVVAVTGPVVRHLFRLRVRGLEHVPKEGGFVLAANHTSSLDGWPLGLPLYPRPLYFMAKSELFNAILAPFMRGVGAFPVRRGERDDEALRTAVGLVRRGHIVAMFPEGTRRRKGLRKRHRPRVHTGTARIALEAGAPLVPAAIRGTDRLARLGPMSVIYGPPVTLDDLRGHPPSEVAREATRRLWAEIQRLETELKAEA